MLDTAHAHRIPMLPASVIALLGVGTEDSGYFERVHEIVQRDPSLVTLSLQFANSAGFAGQSSSESLHQAIMRIGARRFVSMVLSSLLVQVFAPASEELAKLWRHAIATSIAARNLAVLWPLFNVAPDWAAVAGLVHNLGAMVLAVRHVEPYRKLLAEHDFDDDEIIRVERSTFGGDHQQVGRTAAEQMALPADLIQVIQFHHSPARPAGPLVWIVRTAAAFGAWARAQAMNDPSELQARKRVDDGLDALRLNAPADVVLGQILSGIETDTKREAERLGIPAG